MRKILSMTLAIALVLGLATPALATGPTFSDVPSTYWGYADIEAVAEAGLMNGTGNGAFSPEMKVSVAQFLTLLGRLVFPEVKTEGTDWFGPYVSAAQNAGLLAGTQVDVNQPEAEISRYDMAVILRAAGKKLGVAEKAAQSSEVTDYGVIPNMYTDAVLAVYGMGLIKGDQAGNFNGSNTMMRAEVATVIMRLAKAKPGSGSQGGTTDPGATTKPDQPSDATYYLKLVGSVVAEGVLVVGERTNISCTTWPNATGLADAPYGRDRGGFVCSSSNPSIVQVERNADNRSWALTALSLGPTTITLTDPYGVSASFDISVVDKRDGVGIKNYTVGVYVEFEKHDPRGGAYTEATRLYDTPFKLYYTRDGGKTSQLVAEGRTPTQDSGVRFTNLDVELPEDAFYSEDSGFYVSAEAVVDGQRVVTSDLRTDGRDYITITKENRSIADKFANIGAVLTPPEGEKADFTFKGYVEGGNPYRNIGGITVQLYHKNGTLLGETVSQEDGSFALDFQVDALDGAFDKKASLYQVVAFGYDGEWRMEITGLYGEEKLPRLRSLVELEILPESHMDTYGTFVLRVPIVSSKDN